jgi:hypothetical protein
MEDQTDQLKYLKRMLRLGYTHQQALDAWEKTKLSNRKIDSPAKNRPREFLSGSVKLKTFIEYLRETLNKKYWDDLIKIQDLKSCFGHFDSKTSTQATAADALKNIIAEKKIRTKYYPSGHPQAGNRTLRSQWKELIDAGWQFLNFNPLLMKNHVDCIDGKTEYDVVSSYLQFVINDFLLQRFDKDFKDSAQAKQFYKGFFFSITLLY